jgi:hypothetical protein
LDKIRDLGTAPDGKMQYMIQTTGGVKYRIETYEDLRNGNFEELVHFGKIPNEVQRQRWLKEQGVAEDAEREKEIIRQKQESDVPQRPVTVEEVRKMIVKSESKSKSK